MDEKEFGSYCESICAPRKALEFDRVTGRVKFIINLKTKQKGHNNRFVGNLSLFQKKF